MFISPVRLGPALACGTPMVWNAKDFLFKMLDIIDALSWTVGGRWRTSPLVKFLSSTLLVSSLLLFVLLLLLISIVFLLLLISIARLVGGPVL